MRPQTRSEIAALLERHGVSPAHRLGQHFLADPNITRRIVELAGVRRGDRVVEVGAGTGTLTRALAAAGAEVVAYEVDRGLIPVLEEVTAGLPVKIRHRDVTEVDLAAEIEGGDWKLVANLPYNVGTPLLLDVLRRVPQVGRMVVMVQREVAERLVAAPGSDDYGLPSVVAALHATARVAMRVPPQVFYPAPNVESAVVVLDRIPPPPEAERAVELAAAGFGQRRKMLRRSLAGVLEDAEAAIAAAGLDPTARAEQLTPSDFVELARQ